MELVKAENAKTTRDFIKTQRRKHSNIVIEKDCFKKAFHGSSTVKDTIKERTSNKYKDKIAKMKEF